MTEKEETQEEVEAYCKICKSNGIFITSLSPTGYLVCTQCRFVESMVPFKMVSDQFGHRIIK